MSTYALQLLHAYDRWRSARVRARFGAQLEIAAAASPRLHLIELRIEPGAQVRIADGFATERRRGNQIWAQADSRLTLGARAWLRTEYGNNYITLFPGARIEIGPDALINAAMLHAKREICIGSDLRLGFGARILDADLHDLDSQTP